MAATRGSSSLKTELNLFTSISVLLYIVPLTKRLVSSLLPKQLLHVTEPETEPDLYSLDDDIDSEV